MSNVRLLIINLLLVGILAGSLTDMLWDREHWPFSSYPMYSRLELKNETTKVMLYGVPRNSADVPFPLQSTAFIQPFDRTRLNTALARLARSSQPDKNLRAAAEDVWERYRRSRSEGRHAGPPLREVRVYQVHWRLRPDASNVNTPDDKQLLLTIDRPESEP